MPHACVYCATRMACTSFRPNKYLASGQLNPEDEEEEGGREEGREEVDGGG